MTILLTIICILIVLYLAALYGIYRAVFGSRPIKKRKDLTYNIPTSEQYQEQRDVMVDLIRNLKTVPYEEISCRSRDGLILKGRYYKAGSKPEKEKKEENEKRISKENGKEARNLCAILFHGYRSSAVRDFAGGAREMILLGIPTILVDERGQGHSGGRCVTFGAMERYDVLSWTEKAVEMFGKDVGIYLYGISMGGAAVLLSSGLPLPENVKGIVADCPFSSAKDIICTVIRGMHLSDRILYPLIFQAAGLFGHFSLNHTNVRDAVKKASVPILIVHGEDDRFVPVEESRAIQKASPEKVDLEIFPKAGHGISYILDRGRYQKLIQAFMGFDL